MSRFELLFWLIRYWFLRLSVYLLMRYRLLEVYLPFPASRGFPDIAADRARIRARALSPHGKPPRVPRAAIGFQILLVLDIFSNLLAELAFDRGIFFNPAFDFIDFIGSQVLRARMHIHLALAKRFFRERFADAVKIRKRDDHALLIGDVDAE